MPAPKQFDWASLLAMLASLEQWGDLLRQLLERFRDLAEHPPTMRGAGPAGCDLAEECRCQARKQIGEALALLIYAEGLAHAHEHDADPVEPVDPAS